MNSVGDRRRPDWSGRTWRLAESKLGKLVQFHSRRQVRAESREEQARSAEILIFTGVRYERTAPESPMKPTTPRAKRKRG